MLVHATLARRAVALLAAAEHINNLSRSGRLLLRFSQQFADQIVLFFPYFFTSVGVGLNRSIFVEQMMGQRGDFGSCGTRGKEAHGPAA